MNLKAIVEVQKQIGFVEMDLLGSLLTSTTVHSKMRLDIPNFLSS
jgi:hypothetical protein